MPAQIAALFDGGTHGIDAESRQQDFVQLDIGRRVAELFSQRLALLYATLDLEVTPEQQRLWP
jgi:hypothetical protein